MPIESLTVSAFKDEEVDMGRTVLCARLASRSASLVTFVLLSSVPLSASCSDVLSEFTYYCTQM